MVVDTWSTVLINSFLKLWGDLVAYVPNLVIALVIVILGWIIGALFGRVVSQVFKSIKVDTYLSKAGVADVLERGGMELNSGAFIGALVKWFFILVFLTAAFEVLGLVAVNNFLQDVVLSYLPQVIVAALVLVAAGVLGDLVKRFVVGAVKAANVGHANMAGSLAKWSIWIFGAFVALSALGIGTAYLQTLFTGIVVAAALAVGLSFGLGGQEAAAQFIEKIKREVANK